MLRAEFMVAQAGLPVSAGEALFTALEPTSHALSAGSLNIAYFRFNNSAVDQAPRTHSTRCSSRSSVSSQGV
jgi:hypothetical protein